MERVKAVRDRIRPPLKTPDEDLRIAPIAGVNLAQPEDNLPAIKNYRDCLIGEKRADCLCERAPALTPAGLDRGQELILPLARVQSCVGAVR
jgi:hypothetical protein